MQTKVFEHSSKGRKATEVMDHTLNLSDLRELLHNTLLITEEVKEVLRKNCNEAAFVLKPWRMKTVVEKEKDESICNCKKVASENEAEKIAAGIDKAITLAQDLRERVKLNVAPRKVPLKNKPIENVYSLKLASVNDPKKALQKNVASQKANITKTSNNKNSVALKSDKMISVSTEKTVSSNSIGGAKQSSTTDKMQSKPPAKITSKSRKERNFILENKLSVKKIISPNKSSECDFDNSPGSSKTPVTSAAELSSLIHKMAQQSMESALISSSDSNKTKCPLHEDNNMCQSLQERITTVDVIKAFQYFNIPNEIVKALKTYHGFLKIEINNVDNTNNKRNKYKDSVDIFLQEFEVANAIIRNHSHQEFRLIKVATESVSSFGNIFNENLSSVQINDIKNAITESGAVLKRYNIDNIIEPIIERPSCNLSLTEGWMSNGVWNIYCMERLKNLFKAYNIRYNNKNQLLSLYEAIQKLQRSEYLNTLIRILLHDVIPAVKSAVDPASVEYARLYKTMFVLQQGLNPEMPVLVRTDD